MSSVQLLHEMLAITFSNTLLQPPCIAKSILYGHLCQTITHVCQDWQLFVRYTPSFWTDLFIVQLLSLEHVADWIANTVSESVSLHIHLPS
jgi:hypothetical protein